MKYRHGVFATLALVVAGGAVWWSKDAGNTASSSTKVGKPAVPVLAATAQQADMPVFLEVVGRAEAYQSVSLKSRVDGQVASVLFHEGQHVKPGQLLIRLDSRDYDAKLAQAEANVLKSETQIAKARADVTRYTALKERNFISQEKLNEVTTNANSLIAGKGGDKAAAEFARLQQGYTQIRAPFAGIVGAKLVFPGAAVKTNDTVLAVVNQVQPLYVTFNVAENHLSRLRAAMQGKGLQIQARIPGQASGETGAAMQTGTVRFIDNAVDPASGSIQLKAVVPNTGETLTPGQFLNVRLQLDTAKNVVIVPNEAVQQGQEGSFLYVIKPDNSVEIRKIKVVSSQAGRTALDPTSKIQPGEVVVTDGQLRLTPGAKAQIKAKDGKPADTPTPVATQPATPAQAAERKTN